MKKTLGIIPILFLLLGGYSLCAADYYVQTPSGLVLRDAPAKTGKKILLIPFQAKITSENNNLVGEEMTLDNIRTSWLQVSYKNKIGYVFRGLIAPYKPIIHGKTDLAAIFTSGLKLRKKSVDKFECDYKKDPNCDIKREYSHVQKEFASADGQTVVIVNEDSGYENGGVAVTVSGLTLEDAFLISRNFMKIFSAAQFGIPFEKEEPSEDKQSTVRGAVRFEPGKSISFQFNWGGVTTLDIEVLDSNRLKISQSSGL